MHIDDKVKKAKIKLFRREFGLQFFGALSYKFNWKLEELPESIEGYVLFDELNTEKSADGTIHINKNFASRSDYSYDNLIGLIIHEILHILHKHGVRKKYRTHEIWNAACDHVVDRELKQIGNVTPYKNKYNIFERLDSVKPKCTAEEAYEWLNQQVQKMNIQFNTTNGDSNSTATFGDKITGQQITVNLNQSNPTSGSSQSTDIEANNVASAVERFLSSARSVMDNMGNEDRGRMPGNLSSILDELLKVEIPWDRLIEKAIKRQTILKPDSRSWMRLNPYYVAHGITLPSTAYEESNEGIGTLILTVDSSGSISDNDLKKFSWVIYNSLHHFKKAYVIIHDHSIQQEKVFDIDNRQSFIDFIEKEGYKGRGGTSHQETFNRIQKIHDNETDEDDEISMIISLTDGFSDIEQEYKNHKWIKELPLVFVVSSSWSHEFPEDYPIEFIYIQ